MGCGSSAQTVEDTTTVYDYPVNGKNKQPYDMQQHKGQAMIVMNTASQCGYTKSGYTTATELHKKYKDQGFTVLGFPCNQFGKQEPGDAEQVQEFACKRFKAEFPIMDKVEVNGDNASPLWSYMKRRQPGILGTESIKWNFTMFLIDRDGKPVERYGPGASTEDIEKKLIPLLAASPSTNADGADAAVACETGAAPADNAPAPAPAADDC